MQHDPQRSSKVPGSRRGQDVPAPRRTGIEIFFARDMPIEPQNVTFDVRGRDSGALVCYVSKIGMCNRTRNVRHEATTITA